MSLGRTFKRIREMWTVLEKYFRSLRDRVCPKFLRQIFDDELTPRSEEWKVVVCFMCFAFDQFNQLNVISQKPTLPFPFLAKQIKSLKVKLELSLHEEFYGEETCELLKQLENDGAIYQKNKLKAAFKQFYEDASEYLGNWSRQFSETDEVIGDWVIFESEPTSEKVRKAYRHFCGASAQEMDALFGEIAELKQTLKELEGDRFNRKNVDEKWETIFKNPNFVMLKSLVSAILSIFPSNAFSESVFSVLKNIKTDERNSIGTPLLNSLISIKFNSKISCPNAHNYFLSLPNLLKQDLFSLFTSIYGNSLPALFGQQLLPIYSQLPNMALVLPFYYAQTVAFEVSNISTIYILMNRFTSIAFPFSHKKLWKKSFWILMMVMMIVSLTICYPITRMNTEFLFYRENYSDFFIAEKRTDDYFYLGYLNSLKSLTSMLFLILAFFINAFTLFAYRQRKKENKFLSDIEKKLLIYALLTFAGHALFATFLIIIVGIGYAGLIFCQYPWITDLCTLVLSSWLLLCTSDSFRHQLIKDFCPKFLRPMPTQMQNMHNNANKKHVNKTPVINIAMSKHCQPKIQKITKI